MDVGDPSMDNKEMAKLMLKTMLEVKDTVSTLDERSRNFYDLMEKQGTINFEHLTRIEVLEKKVAILERDRWWVGVISAAIGSALGCLTSIFSHKL